MSKPHQIPLPGTHHLLHGGDILEFTLTVHGKGKAFLRTNIGKAAVRRAETISLVRTGLATAGQDWHDIPMNSDGNGVYSLKLALIEAGHFEAKCFFMPEDTEDALWPDGDNVHVNVSPADYCCGNSIYCAFVRQFGPNCTRSRRPDETEKIHELDHQGYTIIPKSGTFRDLIGKLDHIFNDLQCRILHLLPINPTPTVYARMGRFGSPYASLDFTAVDPSLAEFDTKATPLEQFLELVDAVHGKDGKIFIDIAVNHTGWAAKIHETHPEWLKQESDGTIISPGAWGTIWADLTELDYSNKELWKYIANVFLTWCQRGVDGFRCDAGYMIPVPAWEYIIAEVRNEFPDTIFLLEGLGGDPAVTSRLLDFANMNWAYSELFQNYSKDQVEGYLKYAWKQSEGDGLMVHYAETHDNSRMAAVSPLYARMRTGLCALASSNGAFGFANGVEWFATEKIDVHEASGLSWGNPENQVEFIGQLNTILQVHPAFHNGSRMEFLNCSSPHAVLIKRCDQDGLNGVLAAVNLDCSQPVTIRWKAVRNVCSGKPMSDLLTGRKVMLVKGVDDMLSLTLAPGEVLCLTCREVEAEIMKHAGSHLVERLSKTERQKAQNMAVKTLSFYRNTPVMQKGEDPEIFAASLLNSPEEFLHWITGDSEEKSYTVFQLPEDLRREVMIPPKRFVLILSPARFRVRLAADGHIIRQYDSLTDSRGRHFAIFNPLPAEGEHKHAELQFAIFESRGKLTRKTGHLLFLANEINWAIDHCGHQEIMKTPLTFLQANGRGAITHLRLDMPAVSSRYDAIMLANLSTEYPEDRHVMLRRLRMWMVYHARTQEVAANCLVSFETAEDGGGLWSYKIPAGNGMYVSCVLKINLDPGKNISRISLIRLSGAGKKNHLSDDSAVRFILRFDMEDRSFHSSTKASYVEKIWSGCIREKDRGFEFAPVPERILSMVSSAGAFHRADEWHYMIWQPNEAARGLDPHSDVFSPGYFEIPVHGGELFQIAASICTPEEPERAKPAFITPEFFRKKHARSAEEIALDAIRAFIVKRGKFKSVIAGYPWFLDWGRDTLIAARGLIAAPEFREDVKAILCQFASFAEKGTIPNVIYGSDARNRDTSDAPLWLLVAASDLCKAENSYDFLKTVVRPDGTTLRQTLESVVDGIRSGTPNGIKMDPESALVFSPPHFTWMDTNYPAGTPREGYPIEIQALWFAALSFLASLENADPVYGKLAKQVQRSIHELYLLPGKGWLSDCLHCKSGTPAAAAVADDHLRPNQLLAITLGAVTDREIGKTILDAASSLLIPGAIRSLADATVQYELPICSGSGTLLNNPGRPYCGRYEGDEDTRRKPAYHNGTAWTWISPSYPEAYFMVYGSFGKQTARSILSTAALLFHKGCVGQLPEILDGDYPHLARGCDAQAWGITEVYRVWKLLS